MSSLHWEGILPNTINTINWKQFDYSPQVSFKTLHCNNTLFIKFNVEETQAIRTQEKTDQSPVYQDSCVEFFLLQKNGNYINFEANSNGILLSAIGKNRTNRTPLNNKQLARIKRISSGVILNKGKYSWQLTLGIPFDVLGVSAGQEYRANFYKCGDLTENKHYLSWSPIKTDKPDFHRPEFFGKITFE